MTNYAVFPKKALVTFAKEKDTVKLKIFDLEDKDKDTPIWGAYKTKVNENHESFTVWEQDTDI